MNYKKGEYVQYALNGVCLIEDIKCIDITRSKKPKEFYILKPIALNTSTIYVPVENNELVSKMRPLLSKREADSLIESLKEDKAEWIDDRKERNARFETIIKEADPKELLKLIGCIYIQRQDLASCGKKLSSTDERHLSQAEALIENELAFILKLDNSNISNYIKSKL